MPEQYQCPECAFVIRTDDNDEAVDLAKRHRAEKHDDDADESDVEEHIASVSGA